MKEERLEMENVFFVILYQKAAVDAAELAIQKGVRGMDALLMQTSGE